MVSIQPELARNVSDMKFDDLYRAIGMNTGNLMFTTAMYRQLGDEVKQVDFSFNPAAVNENFEAIVIPAANWLNQMDNWDWFTDLIQQVEIPIVTIGIGLQADTNQLGAIRVNASCERLVRILSTKAPFISTRGFLTTRYLQSIGIMNVVTTGCPSLYMPFPKDRKVAVSGSDTVIQSTRYYYFHHEAQKKNLNNTLFRAGSKNRYDMVYQSEPEEMEYLIKTGPHMEIDNPRVSGLAKLYCLGSIEELKIYLGNYTKTFLDVDEWSSYLRSKARLVGTRLHGAIISLNSGTPAILLAHDSRTSEMIDFAGIPTVSPKKFGDFSSSKLKSAFEKVNLEEYIARRDENHTIYKQFLTVNNLKYR